MEKINFVYVLRYIYLYMFIIGNWICFHNVIYSLFHFYSLIFLNLKLLNSLPSHVL